MSFKENTYQQISFTDSFSVLTAREQKALEDSWAKVFADEIFPWIDEKRFSVLYSDKKASRPNTPINVVVGALIIKELFDYSDELKHYTDPNDFNKVIYHQRSTDADERIEQLLKDADILLSLCESDSVDNTEYELFVRCLSEQTITEKGHRRLRKKKTAGCPPV